MFDVFSKFGSTYSLIEAQVGKEAQVEEDNIWVWLLDYITRSDLWLNTKRKQIM